MIPNFLTFVLLAISGCAKAGSYARVSSLSGQSFLDFFTWYTEPDPTHGRVRYVSKSAAEEAGLYSVSGNTVTLRADDTTVLSPNGPGRDSFRLTSNTQYSTHVAIFDIGHMPEGCSTWPALFGANWPSQGEIDIVEGVNNQIPNLSSLHTGSGCTMSSSNKQTGTSGSANCDVHATGNTGCGVHDPSPNSFGPNFNKVGGGWYAIERSPSFISIYFWERKSSSVPAEVKNPGSTVDTSTWGTPSVYFPGTNCNFGSHLGPMNIVINLALCGDWAGSAFSADGCPGNCVDFVNNNPSAFSNAYFEFNALNIYE